MKLKELKRIVDFCMYMDSESEVMILLSVPSMGPRAMCKVQDVYGGFDWERGSIIIRPETSLIPKPENISIDVKNKAKVKEKL